MRLATASAWGLCIYWRAAQALVTQEAAVNIPSVPSPDLFTSEQPFNPQPRNVSVSLKEPCHLEALTSRAFNITVEVGGDKLLFQWEAGQDLWALARQFRQGRRLMVPPDCISKTTMADLESCVDNHLYMFMQREMMTRYAPPGPVVQSYTLCFTIRSSYPLSAHFHLDHFNAESCRCGARRGGRHVPQGCTTTRRSSGAQVITTPFSPPIFTTHFQPFSPPSLSLGVHSLSTLIPALS